MPRVRSRNLSIRTLGKQTSLRVKANARGTESNTTSSRTADLKKTTPSDTGSLDAETAGKHWQRPFKGPRVGPERGRRSPAY